MGRGMESKPYRKMLFKTEGLLLLLMPLKLLSCNTTEGPAVQGWQQAVGWGMRMIVMWMHICMHEENPKLCDLGLTQDQAYILCHSGRKFVSSSCSLEFMWMLHYSKHFCSVWRPRSVTTQNTELSQLFLKANISMQSPTFIMTSKCQLFERKMSDFLLEISSEKWKLKQAWLKPQSSLVWSELISCWNNSLCLLYNGKHCKNLFFS